MKKVSYFLSLAMIIIGLGGNYSAIAQGRGHKYGHDKNNGQRGNDNRDRGNGDHKKDNDNRGNGNDNHGGWGKDDRDRDRDRDGRDNHGNWDRGNNGNHYGHNRKDHKWDYNHNHRRDHQWERRNVNHYYHTHDRYCGHNTVVVNYVRPRYIYYRDYDVYYDCNRSVYISYSGRSWTMSASLPLIMRNVNIRTASRFEVDYWDDNLPVYLERRRPTCDRIYIGG